jgi:hypothetical protein
MDADVERFLEESRTFFTPEECDAAERVLRGWYEKANDSPEWQEMWDRLREAIKPAKQANPRETHEGNAASPGNAFRQLTAASRIRRRAVGPADVIRDAVRGGARH